MIAGFSLATAVRGSREEFANAYEKLHHYAFRTGLETEYPRLNDPSWPGSREHRRFIAGCHRGYEKTQCSVVEAVDALRRASELSEDEAKRRELVLRRIIDGIAQVILDEAPHVTRRFVLRRKPSFVDLPCVRRALKEVERLNVESRQTFALLSDLSTFIHVGDILRMDFRSLPPRYSILELKSGVVNSVLSEKLDKMGTPEEALSMIASANDLPREWSKQATRMLKQRIRLERVETILATGRGKDPASGELMSVTEIPIAIETYDRELRELIERASRDGIAFGTVEHCLHLGIASHEEPEIALRHAHHAAALAWSLEWTAPDPTMLAAQAEVEDHVDRGKTVWWRDLFHENLYGLSERAFPLWALDMKLLKALVTRRICIVLGFDWPAFIGLCRSVGLRARLA